MVYMTRSDTMRGRYRGDPGGRERSGEAALALASNARSSAERLLCFRPRSPRPSGLPRRQLPHVTMYIFIRFLYPKSAGAGQVESAGAE